jgi:phosphate/sulfate permease
VDWWQTVLIILASIFLGLLAGGLISYLVARFSKRPFLAKREATAVDEERLDHNLPKLLTEIENNRRIATEPWAGNLLPFETQVCGTSQDEVHKLPAKLRADLTKTYDDIRLANAIVWLATEFGRRSQNLDEYYMKLCTNIATRLHSITTPLQKQSGWD